MRKLFPSPTGVNHYELDLFMELVKNSHSEGFRPQQGLTIMNWKWKNARRNWRNSFRPQQGLTIMNLWLHHEYTF